MKALRQTVDLSAYPDLVVVYLGMTVNVLTGVKTLLGFGPKIEGSVAARPDGLLLHENIFYSLFPLHLGMRQYWRDFESLERFTRADPHREWWKQFLRDTGGTGFWHELYSARGGFEAIYVDVQRPIGFLRFAKTVPAKGSVFSARERLHRDGVADTPAPYTETEGLVRFLQSSGDIRTKRPRRLVGPIVPAERCYAPMSDFPVPSVAGWPGRLDTVVVGLRNRAVSARFRSSGCYS